MHNLKCTKPENIFKPVGACAETYYQQLINEPQLERFTCHDETQLCSCLAG